LNSIVSEEVKNSSGAALLVSNPTRRETYNEFVSTGNRSTARNTQKPTTSRGIPADSPQLVITNAQGHQSTLLLDHGLTWRIGRGHSGKVVLSDDAASRRHAMIQRNETGEYYLVDVGSRNGTYIRGRRVSTPVLLKNGDEISIGAHKLLFRNPTSSTARDNTIISTDDQMAGTMVMFAERLVTVLIVDIQGFTGLTQQIGQEMLCKFISRWFSDASAIFRAHGSWALKYIGDAVMAAWLHEGRGEEGQVLSALTALAQFAGVSSAARYSLPVPLSFRAGLNTGIASIGNAGSGEQTEFTAFGEAVNAAFGIEAGTRRIGSDVAIGRDTIELLGGPSSVEPWLREHSLVLKGYAAPVRVWAGSFADVRQFLASGKSQR
jgi:adenylate cyclase